MREKHLSTDIKQNKIYEIYLREFGYKYFINYMNVV